MRLEEEPAAVDVDLDRRLVGRVEVDRESIRVVERLLARRLAESASRGNDRDGRRRHQGDRGAAGQDDTSDPHHGPCSSPENVQMNLRLGLGVRRIRGDYGRPRTICLVATLRPQRRRAKTEDWRMGG
ncbi:MAG TPA: hypothetical protein VJT78_14615 [Candidatus Dormibacteraeota bacterium]|nr:hypothetical protein [Candidatus Dormibacteraeota bacterium]